MAYGGLQGQAPQGVAPINGLPTNDVRELTVRSGNNISAGDVVDVEGGEVFKNVNVDLKLQNELALISSSNHNEQVNSFFRLFAVDGQFIATYNNKNLRYLYQTFNSDGSSNSKGSGNLFEGSPSKFGYCGKYVVYMNTYGSNNEFSTYVGKLNTYNQLSFTRISDQYSFNKIDYTCPIDNNRFIYAYFEAQGFPQTGNYWKIGVCTVNDDSVEYNSEIGITPSKGKLGGGFAFCKVSENSEKITMCVAYKIVEADDDLASEVRFLTVDKSNKIVVEDKIQPLIYGTANEIDCVSTKNTIFIRNNGKITVFDNMLNILVEIQDIPNIHLSNFTAQQLIKIPSDDSVLIVAEFDNITKPGARLITYKNKRLSYGDIYEISNSKADEVWGSSDDKGNVLCIIKKPYTSQYSVYNSVKFQVQNNQIAGLFIDNSKDAIALQSASSSQPISVGFGGYCPCDGVVEGQSINSTGVMAYAPTDGWLDIRPEYEKSCEFGSYIGNGKYGVDNPNTLTFSFAPSMVHLLFRTAPEAGTNAGKNENLTGEGYGNEQKFMVASRLTTDYRQSEGFGYSSASTYGKKSTDGKTFYWYAADMTNQCNATGTEYYYIAFR